jgi:CHASE2 domain-containing sensor protein
MNPEPVSPCPVAYALSLQLAFRYLEVQGISPKFSPEGNLQLGSTVFQRIKAHNGGYQTVDAGGSQILLNYRSLPSPEKIAPQVTLTQVLANQVNPQAVKGRIVLIGVRVATSNGTENRNNGTFRLTKKCKLCIVRDTARTSQAFTGYKLEKHQVNLSMIVVMQ